MTADTALSVFTQAGHKGVDTRHITLRVFDVVDTENGQLVTKKKVFIQGGDGNFTVDIPTFFVFAILEKGWVFEPFEQDGKTWPGLAVTPDNGDFTVTADDPAKRTVVMHDKCKHFCFYRYQIVLKHEATGAIATTDPSVQNVDAERGGF